MEASSVEGRVREITERVTADLGLELVHVEIAGGARSPIVRIFIDKPEGITHDDCSDVSLHVGTVLDVEDFIHSAYTLEVSSPGLARGLYRKEDYQRFSEHLARIKTRQAINGQRNFRGRIERVEGETVIFDDNTNGRVVIPLEVIQRLISKSTLKRNSDARQLRNLKALFRANS